MLNSAHAVTEFREGETPFYKLTGSNTGEGTFGCVVIKFVDRPGKLFMQANNAEEAGWWLDLLRGYPEVKHLYFVPAPDSHETGAFVPPDVTPPETVPH